MAMAHLPTSHLTSPAFRLHKRAMAGQHLVSPTASWVLSPRNCQCRYQNDSQRGVILRATPTFDRGSLASSSPASSNTATREMDEYKVEYNQLKATFLDNTRKSGAALALYFLLTVDNKAALCCFAGSAFSYLYFSWMMKNVDDVKGTDIVPMVEAMKVENTLGRRVAKLGAAYYHALRPRLLVPVSLALLVWGFEQASGMEVPLLYKGCLLAGFLSYKGALVVKLVQDLTPKTYVEDKETRPALSRMDDELDVYGRPRAKLYTDPTEVMPEDVREAEVTALLVEQAEESNKDR